MRLSWWLGIGLGIGVVGLHAVLRVLTHRFALRASERRSFLLLELGGLIVRMALAFGAAVLIFLFAPVHEGAFAGTVVILLVLSMIGETSLVFRQMDRGTLDP